MAAILVVERNLYEELKHSESKRQLYRTAITRVVVRLEDLDEGVVIAIEDNGIGLPEGFSPEKDGSLGWQIVNTLIRDDLHGTLTIERGEGTRIQVVVPHPAPGSPKPEA